MFQKIVAKQAARKFEATPGDYDGGLLALFIVLSIYVATAVIVGIVHIHKM